MSFRLRLTLLYSGLLAGALALFATLLYGVLQWAYVNTVDRTLEQVAGRVAQYYQVSGMLPRLDGLGDRSTFILVRIDDTPVAQSGNFEGLFPLPARAQRGQAVFTTETDAKGEAYRLYTLPLRFGSSYLYVQVAYTLRLLGIAQSWMLQPIMLSACLFVALGALGVWFVAWKAISPVEQVARAARNIGQSGDLTLRVPYRGPYDEIGILVRTFNDMLDRLEGLYARLAASVDAQKRFVADASHELRTPLTIIRGNIDYLKRAGTLDEEALADMASEAERMSRLVEEMLTMARADAGETVTLKPVLLGPLVRDACRKAQAMPHQVEFRTELPEALDRISVLGHEEWLRRALLILIDNAFKYTPSGSVTVRAGRQGSGVVIQVVDTGVGIAPEDLPHVFDRFYRADRARSGGGAGLGLAIAKWTVGVHGGRILVESEQGKGSTFSIWLPVDRGEAGS